MSTEENKAVVRKFIERGLSGRNMDVLDELLAPNYKNPSMGVGDRASFKAMLAGMNAAMPVWHFETTDLIAEGDSVVFRGTMNMTLPEGNKVSCRIITYYRLANGKIVEDEPMSTPALTEVLGKFMPPQSRA